VTDPYVATAAGVYGIAALALIVGLVFGALINELANREARSARVEPDEPHDWSRN